MLAENLDGSAIDVSPVEFNAIESRSSQPDWAALMERRSSAAPFKLLAEDALVSALRAKAVEIRLGERTSLRHARKLGQHPLSASERFLADYDVMSFERLDESWHGHRLSTSKRLRVQPLYSHQPQAPSSGNWAFLEPSPAITTI
jgi:hypothetical protein